MLLKKRFKLFSHIQNIHIQDTTFCWLFSNGKYQHTFCSSKILSNMCIRCEATYHIQCYTCFIRIYVVYSLYLYCISKKYSQIFYVIYFSPDVWNSWSLQDNIILSLYSLVCVYYRIGKYYELMKNSWIFNASCIWW